MSTVQFEDQPQGFQYTNIGKMPEYNLALYIVGALASQGLIVVNDACGYQFFENAAMVVSKCLCGITEMPPNVSVNDQIFDFVMSKP